MIYYVALPIFFLIILGCKHEKLDVNESQGVVSKECQTELTEFISLYWVFESDGTIEYKEQLIDFGSKYSEAGNCAIGLSYDNIVEYFSTPHYNHSVNNETFIYYEIDLGCLESSEPGTLCYFYKFRFNKELNCLSHGIGSKFVQ